MIMLRGQVNSSSSATSHLREVIFLHLGFLVCKMGLTTAPHIVKSKWSRRVGRSMLRDDRGSDIPATAGPCFPRVYASSCSVPTSFTYLCVCVCISAWYNGMKKLPTIFSKLYHFKSRLKKKIRNNYFLYFFSVDPRTFKASTLPLHTYSTAEISSLYHR